MRKCVLTEIEPVKIIAIQEWSNAVDEASSRSLGQSHVGVSN